ncbi:uncharacterized protein LOC110446761 [Mizuhopecten yessoensis]|uniref:uncharacterized protein LOC110446761 n=1 Tax=Mizuhopecten yessoensis TaxID=6573 RepID=UPI000B45BB32|nr:uncharacterized protein LOC110446761 [Mizuhopecten yessoensis]
MEDLCTKAVKIFMEKVTKMILRQKLVNYVIKNIGQIPMFISGSRVECIQGLDSDTDIIYESKTIVATANTEQAGSLLPSTKRDYDAIVVMETSNTHAGYTKVKVFDINQNLSQPQIDVMSLCPDDAKFVSSEQVSQYWKKEIAKGVIFPSHGMYKEYQPHGPCTTFKYGGIMQIYDIDTLFSLKCKWPETATKWLTEHRKCKWPDQNTLATIESMGCSLVPIGHASSSEKGLEWRISFNKAERELVWSFNGTQYACIDFMKIFFHAKISPKFPDVFPSYFIKTTMFWMIEETASEMWRPENLSECLEELLNRLITCIEEKKVRNYFIPLNNMMDTRSTLDLENLLSELRMYKQLGPDKWTEIIKLRVDEVDENDIYLHHVEINSLCVVRHITMTTLDTMEPDTFCSKLKNINDHLERAIGLRFSQNTCLNLQSEIGTIHELQSFFLSGEDTDKARDNLQPLLQKQADTTFCCGRMMLATLHLYQKSYSEAQAIVEDVIRGYTNKVVHYTFHNRDKTPKDEDYADMYRTKSSTFHETLKRFIAFDIACLPILKKFYPKAVGSVMQNTDSVLFINPLFYAHVIHLHCCVASGNLTRASQVADDLVSFMTKKSKIIRQTSDTSLYHIARECLKMVGRSEEDIASIINPFEVILD